jgi:hypothetical protein
MEGTVVNPAAETTAEINAGQQRGTASEVFFAFLKLGLTSFGGPIAHLGYFRDELVVRRKWIDEAGYADLVALCQFLPGPASSQVGFALGLLRARTSRRARGLDGLHTSLCVASCRLCHDGDGVQWPSWHRPASWPQDRRRRCRRTGGLGYGS